MQQNAQDAYDIVVVGGGLVGASLVLALAERGLRIAVLDTQPLSRQHWQREEPQAGLDHFDPRVSAITPASQRFLDSLGVWDAVLERRASPYTDMHVWEADGTGSIHFAAGDIHCEALGHIVENAVLLAALHERLHGVSGVELLAPVSLESLERLPVPGPLDADQSRTVLTLADGRSLRARVLVAADGANSRVRELAGFKLSEWDYEHHAIVTTVRTGLPHQRTAAQRFMDDGVLAFLPLQTAPGVDDQHYCSIVWSVLPERAAKLMLQSDVEFAGALEVAIESRFGQIEHVDPRFSVPLRQRHARHYVQEGIALIGDAAHTIHPLAGQGVNLGFQDASALASQLLQALARQDEPGSLQVLRRYQRQRIGHNLGMMWVMEGFKRLYADQALPLRWLRNAGMAGLDRTVLLKSRIMRSAMGMD
jgi:2-octaprenylphenol hydroxylase